MTVAQLIKMPLQTWAHVTPSTGAALGLLATKSEVKPTSRYITQQPLASRPYKPEFECGSVAAQMAFSEAQPCIAELHMTSLAFVRFQLIMVIVVITVIFIIWEVGSALCCVIGGGFDLDQAAHAFLSSTKH